jgi:hypothetical protein
MTQTPDLLIICFVSGAQKNSPKRSWQYSDYGLRVRYLGPLRHDNIIVIAGEGSFPASVGMVREGGIGQVY